MFVYLFIICVAVCYFVQSCNCSYSAFCSDVIAVSFAKCNDFSSLSLLFYLCLPKDFLVTLLLLLLLFLIMYLLYYFLKILLHYFHCDYLDTDCNNVCIVSDD